MRAKITRREWAAAVVSAGTPALAQTRVPADLQSQAAAEPLAGRLGASGAQALLDYEGQHVQSRVTGEIRRDIEALRKFPLPPAVEPATVFKP